MSIVRRVTVGARGDGSTTVQEDLLDGTSAARLSLWAADASPVVPNDGKPQPFAGPLLPAPGGLHILQLTLPPHFRREADDLHSTPTADCIFQLSGESVLVLVDGEVTLKSGDWLVCNGVVHDWRNDGDTPATLIAIVYGATS